jgi:hypothetical protein
VRARDEAPLAAAVFEVETMIAEVRGRLAQA